MAKVGKRKKQKYISKPRYVQTGHKLRYIHSPLQMYSDIQSRTHFLTKTKNVLSKYQTKRDKFYLI